MLSGTCCRSWERFVEVTTTSANSVPESAALVSAAAALREVATQVATRSALTIRRIGRRDSWRKSQGIGVIKDDMDGLPDFGFCCCFPALVREPPPSGAVSYAQASSSPEQSPAPRRTHTADWRDPA